jgi:DNA-binding transcriptional MerR regulator
MKPATLTVEQKARLAQSDLLRDPRVRELWPSLSPKEQRSVHDPARTVGHRYPLGSGEIARLTGLSERQVRYWADRGLIPSWRKGDRRRFEAVGLIWAFSLARAKQHELRFYRSLLEEPTDVVAAHFSVMRSVIDSRIQTAKPAEARELAKSLATLAIPT